MDEEIYFLGTLKIEKSKNENLKKKNLKNNAYLNIKITFGTFSRIFSNLHFPRHKIVVTMIIETSLFQYSTNIILLIIFFIIIITF